MTKIQIKKLVFEEFVEYSVKRLINDYDKTEKAKDIISWEEYVMAKIKVDDGDVLDLFNEALWEILEELKGVNINFIKGVL